LKFKNNFYIIPLEREQESS